MSFIMYNYKHICYFLQPAGTMRIAYGSENYPSANSLLQLHVPV